MKKALFQCPDCSNEVSKTAKTCPNCGNKKLKKQIARQEWADKDPKDKRNIYIITGVIFLAILIAPILSKPSACDCANIYDESPTNKDYTTKQYNSGKFQDDVDDWVEMGRSCTIEYGNLSEMELEFTKGARSIDEMLGFGRAISNAEKECK